VVEAGEQQQLVRVRIAKLFLLLLLLLPPPPPRLPPPLDKRPSGCITFTSLDLTMTTLFTPPALSAHARTVFPPHWQAEIST
jgi:hypothetical protein